MFIGTSLDGFIARTNGDLEWLTSRGEAAGEYGFQEYIDSIDTIAMSLPTSWRSWQFQFRSRAVGPMASRSRRWQGGVEHAQQPLEGAEVAVVLDTVRAPTGEHGEQLRLGG